MNADYIYDIIKNYDKTPYELLFSTLNDVPFFTLNGAVSA